MIYFAYGSNLDRSQMAARCPAGRFIGVAHLADHRLCFPRRSPIRNCAVASVEPFAGETVWGVTYELTADDLARLDEREGYDPNRPPEQNRYNRAPVMLEGPRREKLRADTYVAVPEADPGLPSVDYLAQMVHAAARHGFPEDYLAKLRALVADPEL